MAAKDKMGGDRRPVPWKRAISRRNEFWRRAYAGCPGVHCHAGARDMAAFGMAMNDYAGDLPLALPDEVMAASAWC